MNHGKVLVFTTAYNAEKTIARAMDSIVNQTYQDWIFYVLDNGSDDDTGLIIQNYAMRDERIQYLAVKNNQVDIIGQIRLAVFRTTVADWYCVLDADDEYDVTFLEKMVAFATENKLDIAACGYEKVDGLTGERLKGKSAGRNFVLEGNAFVDDFIEYRGFTSFLWAKLYSIKLYKSLMSPNSALINWNMVLDSSKILNLFKFAERAGVFGESLYKYYCYPNSLINTFTFESFQYYVNYYVSTRDYLQYCYGDSEISEEHEDFLQAIYLSLFDECYQMLKKANISTGKKLQFIQKMISHEFTRKMFIHEADPKFNNLAARAEYKREILDWVFSQNNVEWYKTTTEQITQLLED